MSDVDIPEPDALDGVPHPRFTAAIFGQSRAETAFLDAFNSGRLHHGWLITGPRGIGKATLAWRIARFLLAQPADGGLFAAALPQPVASLDTPGDTALAHRISALSEPRLMLCRRAWDGDKGRLKTVLTVSEVRRLIGFFHLSAADGGHRVAIVDAVDEMNTAAENALLKILEEPPQKTTLLLISHSPMGLLPTVRSRCRILPCAPLDAGNLARALEGADIDVGNDAGHLGVLAAGSVGEAIRIQSNDGLAIYATLLGLIAQAPRMDRQGAIALAESCTGKGGLSRYDLVLRLLRVLLHRLAVFGASGGMGDEATTGEAQVLAALSPGPHAARIWAGLEGDLTARSAHARAVNLDPASVILDMLIKIDQTAGSLRAA